MLRKIRKLQIIKKERDDNDTITRKEMIPNRQKDV